MWLMERKSGLTVTPTAGGGVAEGSNIDLGGGQVMDAGTSEQIGQRF